MEFREQVKDGVDVIAVIGTIDALTSDALLNAFLSRIAAGAENLVADLSGVDYTSSAGLRALLAIQKAIRQKGGDLRLAGIQPNVFRVLSMSGFVSITKIYEDVEAAVASFSRA